MSSYKTPNVYVEEISKFPPSVAPVATAVPAFIGYTQTAQKNGKDIPLKPTRLSSLLEYEEYFGFGPSPLDIKVTLNPDNSVKSAAIKPDFFLYDSMRMFFANGGGNCYVVSIGDYPNHSGTNKNIQHFLNGIDTLIKEDEPTIILFPDAVFLSDAQLGTVQQHALAQCKKLKDRITVMDVRLANPETEEIRTAAGTFRNNVGILNLDYGAAYVPYLETTLPYSYRYPDIEIMKGGGVVTLASVSADTTVLDALEAVNEDVDTSLKPLVETPSSNSSFGAPFNAAPYDVPLNQAYDRIPETNNQAELTLRAEFILAMLRVYLGLGNSIKDNNLVTGSADEKSLADLHAASVDSTGDTKFETYLQTLLAYDEAYENPGGTVTELGVITAAIFGAGEVFEGYDAVATPAIDTAGLYAGATVTAKVESARPAFRMLYENVLTLIQSLYDAGVARSENLEQLLEETNPVYAAIVQALDEEGITLPPSGAVVGAYAAVDRDRGVYKAPANVSLSSVMGPSQKIDNNQQDDLNVDVNAGKSINAIRAFTGKGTLVWGARTLAGNSNEWRYISVRRFFAFAEESIKKATEPFVFEPNDANTWAKIKSMITNFLTLQWRDGALQGAKPAQAFFVKVGQGETMTALDILEGRLIVEIGLAVVRPAEFIILRFSHKLPEA